MEFDLVKLSSLNHNKMIIYIDNNFKIVLRTVIQNILRTHGELPLEWEDIYYEFLYEAPEVVKEFDVNNSLSFKTFLGIKCRYFTYNTCKKYLSKNHQVMNHYVHVDKSQLENYSSGEEFGDGIDISALSEIEKDVYFDYFVQHKSLHSIEKCRGISRYKIKKLAESIRSKLLVQIKN